MVTPGLFITVEGGEGTGKSTQIALLAQRLRDQGHQVTLTREPGASTIGAKIRRIILDPEHHDLTPRAEALLYAADRAQHVATVIRPALGRGEVVVCDRYVDSSVVYQGHARGLGAQAVRDLSGWASEDLQPDVVLVLDLDPLVGLGRATRGEFAGADRIEAESLAFHRSVREGFLAAAARDRDRYVVVDAAASPQDVAEALWAALSAAPGARQRLAP